MGAERSAIPPPPTGGATDAAFAIAIITYCDSGVYAGQHSAQTRQRCAVTPLSSRRSMPANTCSSQSGAIDFTSYIATLNGIDSTAHDRRVLPRDQ